MEQERRRARIQEEEQEMKPDASDVVTALTRHFKGKGGMNGNDRFLCGGEVRLSSFDSPRIADFIAQDTWTGGYYGAGNPRQYPRHGFEIKISRSDWLNELKQPDKAMAFIRYLHYWSLAIPDTMKFDISELPENWGLYIVSNKGVRVKKAPTENCKAEPMPVGMQVSFMRRVAGMEKHLEGKRIKANVCLEFGHDWSTPYSEKRPIPWCRRCGIPKSEDVFCETTNGDELGENIPLQKIDI